jgi:hypothetical protein
MPFTPCARLSWIYKYYSKIQGNISGCCFLKAPVIKKAG